MEAKEVVDGLLGVVLAAAESDLVDVLHADEDSPAVQLLDGVESAMDFVAAGVPADWDGFVVRMRDGSVFHFTARKVA
jgi:hypothetical protein